MFSQEMNEEEKTLSNRICAPRGQEWCDTIPEFPLCRCQAPHKHSPNWSIIHQCSFKFFQILSIFFQILTTTVFSNEPSLLYSFKNACQILLKRLEPIIKKNPEGAWEEWVSSALSVTANEKVVHTRAESALVVRGGPTQTQS